MGLEKPLNTSESEFEHNFNRLHPQKRGKLRDDLRRLEVSKILYHNNFWNRQRVDGLVILNDIWRFLKLDPSFTKPIQVELWLIMCIFGLSAIYLQVIKKPPSFLLIMIVGLGAAGLAVMFTRIFKAWWFAEPGITILFTVISGIAVLVRIIAAFLNSTISSVLLTVVAALIFSACFVLVFHLCKAIYKCWKHNLPQ